MKNLLPKLSFALLASLACAQQPSLTLERELFQVGGSNNSLQFSPDGKWLASGGARGDVVIMDARDGSIRMTLEASDHWVGCLRFSPDGTRLAAVARTLTLWNLETGEKVAESRCRSAIALAWSRDGKWLACAASNGEAQLLSSKDLSVVRSFELPGPEAVDAIAIDGPGKRLAVGKRSGDTFVFDVATGEQLQKLEQPDWVHSLAWTDDGRLLRLGWKGTLRGYVDEELPVGEYAYRLYADADAARVYVTSGKEVVHFAGGRELRRIAGTGPLALHPDGKLWARGFQGRIEIWRDDELVRSFVSPHRQMPGEAVLTGDGRYAVVIGVRWAGGTAQVFDVATGERVAVDGFPTEGQLVENPQGTEVVLLQKTSEQPGSNDWALRFWTIVGRPRRAQLVREIALDLEYRRHLQFSTPWLSEDLRFLGHADQLVFLDDDKRSWRPDRILYNETQMAQGRYIVSRMTMHSRLLAAGSGELFVFESKGQTAHEVSKHEFDAAPGEFSLSRNGKLVALRVGEEVQVLDVPALNLKESHRWQWGRPIWLDEHHLLGSTPKGLEIGDLRTGEIVSSVAVPTYVRRVIYNRARGIALVVGQDRAQVVRVRLR